MALLLLKANIPFLVLERAKEIKPFGKHDLDTPASLKSVKLTIICHRLNLIGSAIALGPMVAPLFIQLGIYDEFLKRSKYYDETQMLSENLKLVHTFDHTWIKDA